MKKILLLNILFLISSMVYGYTMYSTSSYLHSRNTSVAYTQTYNTRNIGVNTYNNGTLKIGYSTTGYGRTCYYSGTYTHRSGNGNSSGRPSQLRRVKGYDSNGNEIGDNSPQTGHDWWGGDWNFWENEDSYSYYFDTETGTWYRTDGTHWWSWDEHAFTFILKWTDYWEWDEHTKPTHVIPGYHENPVPVGEPIIPSTLLLLSYIGCKILKRKRK